MRILDEEWIKYIKIKTSPVGKACHKRTKLMNWVLKTSTRKIPQTSSITQYLENPEYLKNAGSITPNDDTREELSVKSRTGKGNCLKFYFNIILGIFGNVKV